MSGQLFYPYPVVQRGLSMSLDCPDLEVPLSEDGRALLLYELEPSEVEVRATVLVRSALANYPGFPEEIDVWLVARSPESRFRKAWQLDLNGGTSVEKVLSFNAGDFRGTINFHAVAVTAEDSGEISAGSEISWSHELLVHFTPPLSPPGQTLRIEWLDFQHEPRLSHRAHDLFAILPDGSEGEPVIYLNQGVDRLAEILMSRGTHGAAARIRDAVFVQIVHQAWTSILAGVLGELLSLDREEYGGEGGEELLSEMAGWQAGVLRSWAPLLTGRSDREEAIVQLMEELSGPGAGENFSRILLSDVPGAIQGSLNTANAFEGLCRDSDKFQ